MVDRKSSVRECRNNKSQLHPPVFPTRSSPVAFSITFSLLPVFLWHRFCIGQVITGSELSMRIHRWNVPRIIIAHLWSPYPANVFSLTPLLVICTLYLSFFTLSCQFPSHISKDITASQDHAAPVLFVADHFVESGGQERSHKWRGYSVRGENDGRQGVNKGI